MRIQPKPEREGLPTIRTEMKLARERVRNQSEAVTRERRMPEDY
jgi:hypothetical protein